MQSDFAFVPDSGAGGAAETGLDGSVPLLSEPAADPRLGGLMARCRSFLALPENWNANRARRVDPRLVVEGLQLLEALLRPAVRTPSVVPTAWGSVQIEWHDADGDLEVEVRSLGVYQVYWRRGDAEREFRLTDDLRPLLPLVASFRA
jgi:hypothetical protein